MVVSDPLAPYVIDREQVRAELAAAGMALWYDPRDGGRYRRIPIDPMSQEAVIADYCTDEQERADALQRTTGAYRAQLEQHAAEQREHAQDRAEARRKEERRERAITGRTNQLLEHGVPYPEVRQLIALEFPEE